MENKKDKAVTEQAILNTTSVGLAIFVQRVVKEVNDAFCQILGYSREEIIGKEARNFYPTEEEYQAAGKIYEIITQTGSATTEMRLQRKDGAIINVIMNITAFDKNNWAQGIVLSIINITDRKQEEQRLHASEENFRNSMENSPLGIRIISEDGKTVYANRAILEIYGYLNVEEFNNIPLNDRYTAESYNDVRIRQEKQEHGETLPNYFEVSIIRKDGTIRHLQVIRTEVLWAGKRRYQMICQDITERKQIEQARMESEEKYRLIIENSQDIIFIENSAGKIIFMSPSIKNVLGHNPADLIGRSFRSLIHPDDVARLNAAINLNIKHGYQNTGGVEFRLPDSAGKWRWYIGRGNAVRDANGNFTNFVGIANDINERKQTEAALAASEQNFRNSIDNSLMGVRIVNSDGYHVYVNQVFLDIFGYQNIDEVRASPPQEHYTPESRAAFARRHEQHLRGELLPDEMEIDIIRKDDAVRHVQIFRREVYWDGIQQSQVIYNDITERKQAEKQKDLSLRVLQVLNQSGDKKELISSLLELFKEDGRYEAVGIRLRNGDDYPYYQTDGFTEEHIKEENRLCRIDDNGKPARDSRNNPVLQCMCGNIIYRRSGILKPFFTAGGSFWTNSTTDFLAAAAGVDRKTGNCSQCNREGYESVALVPLRANDMTIGLLQINDTRRNCFTLELINFYEGLAQSIGIALAQKQAEEEKQQLEDEAHVNSRLAAVGEMAAGIAHEINNPLTGVIGFSELILERDNLPEDLRKDILVISEGSRRVADIIKRLLTFARQTKPHKTTVDLNEIIDNTLKLRAYYLKTNNIELITKFDTDLPLSVVDPGQLQQVFVNLIVNAEQAMKKAHGKGTLTVTTEKHENNIRISFRDDGPGISKENMGRVFEPFYTTKEPGEGTGLGLSLSRSIILEHNGRMTVESEPGRGAMFIIDLPVYNTLPPEGGARVSASAEKAPPKKQLRILVVDDESSVRYVLERVLKHLNYSVDTIADAKTALEKIAAGENYDVILTDIRMPGMNGIEMYSYILEKAPSMANKTIFVTGDVMGTDVREFLVRYNLPYLSKPFHVKAVKDKIDDVLRIKHRENGSSGQNAG